MPCIVPGCVAPQNPDTALWNTGALCNNHYIELYNLHFQPGLPTALVKDLIRIHALMHYNDVLCLQQMTVLEGEMAAASGAVLAPVGVVDPRFVKLAGGNNYLKLSRALEYYEGYCWFPANRILITGLLTGENFLSTFQYGVNKDHYPDRKHGEQSHRIQLHVIMRLVTAGFTVPISVANGWSHSPLELFYEMSPLGRAQRSFALAMDASRNPMWGNPDNVMDTVTRHALPYVSTALQRRVDKHGGMNPATRNEIFGTRDNLIIDAMIALAARGITNTGGEDVIKHFYFLEKTGFKKASIYYQHLRTELLNIEATRLVLNPLYVTQIPALPHATHRKIGDNLLRAKGSPSKLEIIDRKRVMKSRNAFHAEYNYLPTGAVPLTPKNW